MLMLLVVKVLTKMFLANVLSMKSVCFVSELFECIKPVGHRFSFQFTFISCVEQGCRGS